MAGQLHVIFGTGPLGKSVMRPLVARGERVRMVNRSGKADVPAEVEVCAGDAYQIDQVIRLTEGAAVVYQCAQPEYHEWAEKFPPLQAAILEGAAASGAKLVIGDNLYSYGDTNGVPMTENTPIRPNSRKGKVRAVMAQTALDAHRNGRLPVAIVKGSDFFGAHDHLSGDRFFYPAIAGKQASTFGSLDQPHTFTYIDDFGLAMATVGAHDDAYGQVWHAPSDAPVTQRELIRLVFEAAGSPPKMTVMGRMMLRIGGLFIKPAREVIEMLYQFEKPFIMDSSKFTKRFGIEATPLRQAVAESVAWFRAHPKTK
jgi:nucleoside-diphosphate-sugar epimerase